MSDQALIIFVKNPELGKVKTRLAATVGDEKALKIYKQLLSYTRSVVSDIDADIFVYYSRAAENDIWNGFNKRIQSLGDLGEKMSRAFEELYATYKKVCIIGTDCAEINKSHIVEAFQKLDDRAFVIGPAKDGGYYLLGMNQFYPTVFTDVDWSTAQVLSQTLGRIEDLKKEYFLLPELNDVDTEEDWDLIKHNFKH